MAKLVLSVEDCALIDQLAEVLIPMGMTQIEARIQGLMMISPKPLTLDEMVELLKVSKSSVSVATRELERHGAAERFSERGSKRLRYGISDRPTGFLSAQVEFLEAMGNLLRKQAVASPSHATSRRRRKMGTFFLHVRDALYAALKKN